MSDNVLRETNIGFRQSLKSDLGIEFAVRYEIYYECEDGHVTSVPFFSSAQIPPIWDCKCGKKGTLRDSAVRFVKKNKKKRSHWDMYKERRSKTEMKQNFEEILEKLKNGKLNKLI
jgi:hypothetical protein